MTTREAAAVRPLRADAEPTQTRHSVFLMTNSFETGGSERQFSALASTLNRNTFQVSLGCIMSHGAFLNGLGEVAAFPLGGSLYKLESWKTRAKLARKLQNDGIAVAHAFDFYTNLTLLPAANWARIPVAIGSQRQLGDLLTPAQFRAQLWSFRLADAVVCNSRAAADRLAAAGVPHRKLVVIPNGMPRTVFASVAPAIPRVTGVCRIGMVARMNSRSKNHSGFLRALAVVRDQIPNLEAILAGDGPLRSQLEQEARDLGISQIVRFLGDRRDVPSIFASLDLSVLPSLSESLSNSIIESMAQGVPVVAANVGGNEELLANGRGILVQSSNVGALANAILDLVKDEHRRKAMGAAAQRYAQDNFTIEKMSRQHEELYLQLLQRKQ